MSAIVANDGPFLLPSGDTTCLQMHEFSATPGEIHPLGDYLGEKGYIILGIRVDGNALYTKDLPHKVGGWLTDVEDGLGLLH